MLEELKREANYARTENGALTYASTRSDCLDLFATAGAIRSADAREIEGRFLKAYAEDPDLAMKILFFTRDVRGGLGERRVFRVILSYLAVNEPRSAAKNVAHIAEFGRYDDLLCLLGTPCEGVVLEHIERQFRQDLADLEAGKPVSLLAKWLPSVNASSAVTVWQAKRVARALRLTDAQYRKALAALRKRIQIIENNLRERDYTFNYEKQPSKALFKYRKAFTRNDAERYRAFLDRAASGEAVLKTGSLAPYEIICPFFDRQVSGQELRTIDATWNAQEDFTGGENALVVIDGSGSMYGGAEPLPAAVALALGIYFAERNTGHFRNHFITFSRRPRLVEIKGNNILEKVRYCHNYNEVADTNLQAVFDLILNAAVKNRLPQSELPAKLYIISDMEFNACVVNGDVTNFAYAKRRFAEHGYALPEVVFWNVASRNKQQPVTKNEQGAVLVSGCTPRIFSMLSAGTLDPYAMMLEILGAERYAEIVA